MAYDSLRNPLMFRILGIDDNVTYRQERFRFNQQSCRWQDLSMTSGVESDRVRSDSRRVETADLSSVWAQDRFRKSQNRNWFRQGQSTHVRRDDGRQKIIEVIKSDLESLNNGGKLERTHKMTVSIDTGDAKPFKQRPYWWSPYMLAEVNKEIDRMLENDAISPSDSPWSSPILLVKKSSGGYRLCFDGSPLPRVDRILSMLRGAKFISSIDLKNAFWQIPLDPDSKPKRAFAIPGRGLFHFNVLPFGLTNAAQRQQCLVDRIFGPELEPHVFVYLDDLIIIASSFEKHVQTLREVIERLGDAGLTVNAKKCQLFRSNLKYLGFIVDENGPGTDPDTVAAMVSYPVPKTSAEIKRFVGMCSWKAEAAKDGVDSRSRRSSSKNKKRTRVRTSSIKSRFFKTVRNSDRRIRYGSRSRDYVVPSTLQIHWITVPVTLRTH
uniref:Reverse transcriptase domain-containing protein n=1 Tax=Tenebrio molitor TaxID=7067 RepID=A0A8J6L6C7_TENMO|nr:hypothetical protein GEV33_014734 [Tenebrio molitor]